LIFSLFTFDLSISGGGGGSVDNGNSNHACVGGKVQRKKLI